MSRSFVAGKSDQGRYRVVEQGMLPKFGAPGAELEPARPKRNTLSAKPGPVRAAIPPGHSPLSSLSDASSGAACAGGPQPDGFKNENPGSVEAAIAATDQSSPIKARKPDPVGRAARSFGGLWRRWFSSSNPFQNRTKTSAWSYPPRQAELRLDAVKVVRNDLGDADFEVVAAGTASGKPGKGVGRTVAAAVDQLDSGPTAARPLAAARLRP